MWKGALEKHVIAENIPVPGSALDLQSLSSEQLEVRTMHAIRFHKNWHSSRPTPCNRIEYRFPDVHAEQGSKDCVLGPSPCPVSNVIFLNSHDGELFVTVSAYNRVVLWKALLHAPQASIIAEGSIEIPGGRIISVVANEDPKNLAVLAIAVVIYPERSALFPSEAFQPVPYI